MIIPNANLISYAHNQSDPEHAAALAWWKALLVGDVDIGIPIIVVLAFLRLTTSPRILSRPLSVEESGRRVETWFDGSRLRLISPCQGVQATWGSDMVPPEQKGAQVVTVNCRDSGPTAIKTAR